MVWLFNCRSGGWQLVLNCHQWRCSLFKKEASKLFLRRSNTWKRYFVVFLQRKKLDIRNKSSLIHSCISQMVCVTPHVHGPFHDYTARVSNKWDECGSRHAAWIILSGNDEYKFMCLVESAAQAASPLTELKVCHSHFWNNLILGAVLSHTSVTLRF